MNTLDKIYDFQTKLLGNHNVYNILELICDTLKKGESDKGELEKMDK